LKGKAIDCALNMLKERVRALDCGSLGSLFPQ
jgi:hypothetical protein